MAHGITSTDVFSFTGNRSNIWHKMGVEIPEGLTAVEALPRVGLDWATELAPVFATVGRQQVALPEHRAHIRRDTGDVLGLVSDGYKALDNGDLARFADGVAQDGARVSTAGSLLGGKRVFVTLKLPRVIVAGKNDEQHQYLVTSNGHGGFASLRVYTTSVRVVCQNTINLSERDVGATSSRFYHTGNMEEKMRAARFLLGNANAAMDVYAQQVQALANRDLTVAEVRDFFAAAFASTFGAQPEGADEDTLGRWLAKREGMIADWSARFENERQTLPGIQGTAWAALNSYTEWADHDRGGNRVRDRQHSNVFGANSVSKRKVLELALSV